MDQLANKSPHVLICGGGNAVHVIASMAGSVFPTSIISLYQGEAERLRAGGGKFSCKNDLGAPYVGTIETITDDPAEVGAKATMIILSVPSFTHESYVRALAPYIQPGTMLGALPGEGGFDLCVRSVMPKEQVAGLTVFATETLPWACRVVEYGKSAEVLGTKLHVDISGTQEVVDMLAKIVGKVPELRLTSMLSVTLMNINAQLHPAILYGRFHDWCDQVLKDKALFYEGVDDDSAAVIDRVSMEVQKIKGALLAKFPGLDLSGVRHVSDWLKYSYGHNLKDTSSLRRMLNSNYAYRGLTHPMKEQQGGWVPDFNNRYLTEDIPMGLCVMRGIAEMLAIPTPQIDALLTWAQSLQGKEWLTDSGLNGKDLGDTRCPQKYGYKSVDDFVRANQYIAA